MRQGEALKRTLLATPVWTPASVINAYRTVPLLALRKYSHDPLNTAGSVITGGRYNAPQEFPEAHEMLYLAENTAIAHAEARVITAVNSPLGIVIQPGSDQRPRLDITVKLRLNAVLDLTNPLVASHLDLQEGDLYQPWLTLNLDGTLALTQQLARMVLDSARYDAILYPSARYPGGRNYAVLPQRVAPEDRVIHDPDNELDVFRTRR